MKYILTLVYPSRKIFFLIINEFNITQKTTFYLNANTSRTCVNDTV